MGIESDINDLKQTVGVLIKMIPCSHPEGCEAESYAIYLACNPSRYIGRCLAHRIGRVWEGGDDDHLQVATDPSW